MKIFFQINAEWSSTKLHIYLRQQDVNITFHRVPSQNLKNNVKLACVFHAFFHLDIVHDIRGFFGN